MAKIEVSKEKLEELIEMIPSCDCCPLDDACDKMPGTTCNERLNLWLQNDMKRYCINARLTTYPEYEVEAPNLEEAVAQVKAVLTKQCERSRDSYNITAWDEIK